ncbi:hypothetical protein Tco_0452616 [Tanacetum coccineum]
MGPSCVRERKDDIVSSIEQNTVRDTLIDIVLGQGFGWQRGLTLGLILDTDFSLSLFLLCGTDKDRLLYRSWPEFYHGSRNGARRLAVHIFNRISFSIAKSVSPDTSLCGVSKAWSLSRKVGMCRAEVAT